MRETGRGLAPAGEGVGWEARRLERVRAHLVAHAAKVLGALGARGRELEDVHRPGAAAVLAAVAGAGHVAGAAGVEGLAEAVDEAVTACGRPC